jgi:FkbM family methyltransferase
MILKIKAILRQKLMFWRYKIGLPKYVTINSTDINLPINDIQIAQFVKWIKSKGGLNNSNTIVYEPNHTKLFLELFKENEILIDVGSHIGYFSLLGSKKLKCVYSFEILKTYFKSQQKIIELNQIKNIKLFNSAVGDGKEEIEIVSFADFNKIKSISLDKFCNSKKINLAKTFVKMDIEGYEYYAIKGFKNSIIEFNPTILISIHKKFMSLTKYDWLIDFLFKNYQYSFLIEDHSYDIQNLATVNSKDIEKFEIVDILFSNKKFNI